MTAAQHKPIRIGVSACLLGENVRYNGGHQHDPFITGTLGQFFQFVPVCPEVGCGLGVPRETMRLTGDPHNPRLVTTKSGIDYTDRMTEWAAKRVPELEKENLCGFIFKSKSPSSGMERIKIYGENNRAVNTGVGLFARSFMEHFPLLPVEDDGRLHDPGLRENFIERIFAFRRWRNFLADDGTIGGLVQFHTAHKLQLMAHSPKHYREMGSFVAGAKHYDPAALFSEYEKMLLEALKLKATVKKNTNVLHHMMGYFKKQLSDDEKQELVEVIEQYRKEFTPLVVPVTLINHYVRKYGQNYLAGQHYLHPHPVELKLRNHA